MISSDFNCSVKAPQKGFSHFWKVLVLLELHLILEGSLLIYHFTRMYDYVRKAELFRRPYDTGIHI